MAAYCAVVQFCKKNLFRCTIVGSYMMEDQFLEKEGIFLLLDLLEVRGN